MASFNGRAALKDTVFNTMEGDEVFTFRTNKSFIPLLPSSGEAMAGSSTKEVQVKTFPFFKVEVGDYTVKKSMGFMKSTVVASKDDEVVAKAEAAGLMNWVVMGLGLLLRIFIPVTYMVEVGGKEVGEAKAKLFGMNMELDDAAYGALSDEEKLVMFTVLTVAGM